MKWIDDDGSGKHIFGVLIWGMKHFTSIGFLKCLREKPSRHR